MHYAKNNFYLKFIFIIKKLFIYKIIKMQQAKKSSWPELLNTDVDQAINIIKQQRPQLKVDKISDDSMVTMDIRDDRVRVFHNESN